MATIAENINNKTESEASVEASDSSLLVSLRVKEDEEVLAKMEELQTIILDEKSTLEEKNEAYESLQSINTNKGKEDDIEKLIKKEFSLNSFVKINGDKISITIASEDHNYKLANDIITKIQSKFNDRIIWGNNKRKWNMKKNILTSREKEVFSLLVKNKSTNEIAKSLGISEKTVRNHISNTMQKLGVKGRASAVVELIKLGEIDI